MGVYFDDTQGDHFDFTDPERFVEPEEQADATFEVRRFYREDRHYDVIHTGLTLAEAQAWCKRPDTSTADFFDGYTEEAS